MQNNKARPVHDVQYFHKGDRMSSGYINLKNMKNRRTPFIQINMEGETSGMQKIRINRFFFENRLRWKFDVEEYLKMAVLSYIFICLKFKIIR